MESVYQQQQPQFGIETPLHRPTQLKKNVSPANHINNVNLYTYNLANRFQSLGGEVRVINGQQKRLTGLTIEQQSRLLSMTSGAFTNQLNNFLSNFSILLKISKKIANLTRGLKNNEVLIRTAIIGGSPQKHILTSHSHEDFINSTIMFIEMSKKLFRFNRRLTRRPTDAAKSQKRFILFPQARELLVNLINGVNNPQFNPIKEALLAYVNSNAIVRTKLSKVLWSIVKMYEHGKYQNLILAIKRNGYYVLSEKKNLVIRNNPEPDISQEYNTMDPTLRAAMFTSVPNPDGYNKPPTVKFNSYVGNYALASLLNSNLRLLLRRQDNERGTDTRILVDDAENDNNVASQTISQYLQQVRALKIGFLQEVMGRDTEFRDEYLREYNSLINNDGEGNDISKAGRGAASSIARINKTSNKINRLGKKLEDDKVTTLISSIITLLGYNLGKDEIITINNQTYRDTLSPEEIIHNKLVLDSEQVTLYNNGKVNTTIPVELGLAYYENQLVDIGGGVKSSLISDLSYLRKYRSSTVSMLNRRNKTAATQQQAYAVSASEI